MNAFIITAIHNTKTMVIMSGNGFRSMIEADEIDEIVKKSTITDVKADGNSVIVSLRAPADTPIGCAIHHEGGVTTTYAFQIRMSHENKFGTLYVNDVVPI